MGYTNGAVTKRLTVDCSGDDILTVQADSQATDINKIMARFERTGQVTHLAAVRPMFGNVPQFRGLADALIKVQEADDLFMGLDAAVRERFHNDPVEFIEFFDNPANLDEAVKLGLATKRSPREEILEARKAAEAGAAASNPPA